MAQLAALDAEAVALQEVSGDDWKPLAEDLGYEIALGHTLPGFGNALLYRSSLEDRQRVDLSVQGREPRCALDVVLRIGDDRVRLVTTHFGLRTAERRVQSAALAERLTEGPTIPTLLLLGDFNDWTPGGRQLRPLARLLGPFSRLATFPSRRPLLALDRAACRSQPWQPRVSVVRTRAAREASDHLPLRLELAPATLDKGL